MLPDPEERLGRSRAVRARAEAGSQEEPRFEDAVMEYIDGLPVDEQSAEISVLVGRLQEKGMELVDLRAKGSNELVHQFGQKATWLASRQIQRNS